MTDNSKKTKIKFGDRYDAKRIKNLDPMQSFMNLLMGERADNEAVSELQINMTALNEYVKKKNLDNTNPAFKYTFFHAVLAAIARTIQERPKLNWFIRNKKFWERRVISFAFIAKKQKIDGSSEELIITKYNPDSEISPLEQMHNSTCKMVSEIRNSNESHDETIKIIQNHLKFPSFLLTFVGFLIRKLSKHGRLPKAFVKANPYDATCFVSNLGSIKLNLNYHHLVNFGSNSLFIIIGMKEKKPIFKDDGTFILEDFLPISVTLDERIADGVYFAKSLRILKALLLKPELLDLPAKDQIDYETLLGELNV